MAALTRDFHVFASRVTTGFSAVFFPVGHIAQTRYVRALLALLIRHFGSVLLHHFSITIALRFLDVAPFARPPGKSEGTHSASQLAVTTPPD
jgi:hypothetical protein